MRPLQQTQQFHTNTTATTAKKLIQVNGLLYCRRTWVASQGLRRGSAAGPGAQRSMCRLLRGSPTAARPSVFRVWGSWSSLGFGAPGVSSLSALHITVPLAKGSTFKALKTLCLGTSAP